MNISDHSGIKKFASSAKNQEKEWNIGDRKFNQFSCVAISDRLDRITNFNPSCSLAKSTRLYCIT
jgi:hypothetical protein